ncbi:MAG: DUF1800 domain-containing protein [Solirubrobacterales bacterium]|nr:DUF1800 domain-containing protein [Solirubrobacterales bacterium]
MAVAEAANKKKRKKSKRYKHAVWVDRGDGIVTKKFKLGKKPDKTSLGPRPLPGPYKPPAPKPAQPMGVYGGTFGRVQAMRLLNRAGFGPRPGDAEKLAALGLREAVRSLTRPSGAATLSGPAPTDSDGEPIAPSDAYGHDHLWWLDRMVRSNQQLVERMALVFHDWFATSNDSVDHQQRLIDQSDLFRAGCFGSFRTLLENVTKDPAMLQWLNGIENRKGRPNENYGREMLELFTLGADRGAYTEQDVREAARSLTGWRADYDDDAGGYVDFRYDANRHDNGSKSVFGHTGNWGWQDICRLAVEHPLHASFFVDKLWSYFVPQAPSTSTRNSLIATYRSNDFAIRPVLEAILMHPDLYLGPPIVKPPVVHNAGLLRALGRHIDDDSWIWLSEQAGQLLFWPPNVSGWDDTRWLDTSRMRARWLVTTYALEGRAFDAWEGEYEETEEPEPAMDLALSAYGYPPLRSEQYNELLRLARTALDGSSADWQQGPYRALRQNALLQLLGVSPDLMLA